MAEKTVHDRVFDTMSRVFNLPRERFSLTSSPDTIDNWDSLKHMNLVIALEEEFGIQFSAENIPELLNAELIITVIIESLGSPSR